MVLIAVVLFVYSNISSSRQHWIYRVFWLLRLLIRKPMASNQENSYN